MGMAASQARLVCITARIHDVEYQAQSIQNAKVQLATQEDAVYQEFLNAQNATTLTINTIDGAGNKSLLTANFNNLCSRNRLISADGNEYAIRLAGSGKYIVENEVAENYKNFDDAYAFAAYMIDPQNAKDLMDFANGRTIQDNIRDAEEKYYNDKIQNSNENEYKTIKSLREKLESFVNNSYKGQIETIDDIPDFVADEDKEECQKTLDAYREALYKQGAAEIYALAIDDPTEVTAKDVDMNLFNYYVNLFNKIKDVGCVSIDDFNGALGVGDAANNSDWLQAMIQSGQFYIEATKNGKTDATNPDCDISLSYTTTTTIDKTAYAKAEAKYEHDLKKIDQKDKQFDLDLSKLETERNALTTEYDSVKKVIQDNIDRTFGIFS